MSVQQKKHIVIIGAGFAGLKLARSLNNHPAYSITLIDKNNYHQFQPLLYQVAMANLDASNISFPLRNIFKKSKNVSIRLASVLHINSEEQKVETTNGVFNYDYLVIATGATTNYFGNTEIEKNAYPMKSTLEALEIRNTLLQHFEDALSSRLNNDEKLLSVVIVGGGPTGVELSGALAEMKRDILPDEYPELDFKTMTVYLLEGSANLLNGMKAVSSKKARIYLEQMGVTVKTNTIVKNYDGKAVTLQDGTAIETTFVIWAAGVKGIMPSGINPENITQSNQIKTDIYNRVMSVENIFAVGDIASIQTALQPRGFPQLASVAIDQAKNIAENFKLLVREKNIKPYRYQNKGTMATVGRNKAVVDVETPALNFHGFFAWLIWMTLHLFLLISFKNKLIVFINWVYKYFTNEQSLSLLFKPLIRKAK